MSPAMEASVYAALAEAGVSVLSFGQRPSLQALHARMVVLEGGGRWHVLADGEPLEL